MRRKTELVLKNNVDINAFELVQLLLQQVIFSLYLEIEGDIIDVLVHRDVRVDCQLASTFAMLSVMPFRLTGGAAGTKSFSPFSVST